MLTSRPAEVFGIHDRGRLALGLAADVAVFDPATVGCSPLRRVRDLPAGADRLVADAIGIRAVIVNGTVHPRRRPRRRRSRRRRCLAACCEEDRAMSVATSYPIISADSHITEPPNTLHRLHRRRVARPRAAHGARRERRRRLRDRRHEASRADGARRRGGKAGRGDPLMGVRFEELHRGGWDPDARMADQARDGVAPRSSTRPSAWCSATTGTSTTSRPASTPTTAGSPSTARASRRGCSASGRRRCARRKKASPI